jgi:hypothetical protein
MAAVQTSGTAFPKQSLMGAAGVRQCACELPSSDDAVARSGRDAEHISRRTQRPRLDPIRFNPAVSAKARR